MTQQRSNLRDNQASKMHFALLLSRHMRTNLSKSSPKKIWVLPCDCSSPGWYLSSYPSAHHQVSDHLHSSPQSAFKFLYIFPCSIPFTSESRPSSRKMVWKPHSSSQRHLTLKDSPGWIHTSSAKKPAIARFLTIKANLQVETYSVFI